VRRSRADAEQSAVRTIMVHTCVAVLGNYQPDNNGLEQISPKEEAAMGIGYPIPDYE
jgi:hypothetical protein